MRLTTRFLSVSLCACCLAAFPTYADVGPWAHLDGYRCKVAVNAEAPPDRMEPPILVCQITEGADPIGPDRSPSIVANHIGSALDSLLQLLSTLNHTLHDFSQPQHDSDATPPPAP